MNANEPMNTPPLTRREFMEKSLAAAGMAALAPAALAGTETPSVRTAVDRVVLGRTGLRPTRLGMGTGVNNGKPQVALGKPAFIRLVREAYDRGIRYFDCAEQYHTYPWMADAFEGLPRDELFVLSKIRGVPENPQKAIEAQLQNFKTDYLDCVLMHCAIRPDWSDDRAAVIEALQEARAEKKVRSMGVSCHSLPALRVAAREDFVEVNLVRVNPQGRHMDREPDADRRSPAELEPVLKEIVRMKARGNGLIGMKIIGNGRFREPEEREQSIRFAMMKSGVDAVTIGFVDTAQMDEAIDRMNRALAEA